VSRKRILIAGLLISLISLGTIGWMRYRRFTTAPVEHGERMTSSQIVRVRDRDEKARYEKVQLPLLGAVMCTAMEDEAALVIDSGGETNLPFTVYQRENGRFLRAEFIAPGSVDYATPIPELESAMRSWDEAIIGLVDEPPTAGWKEIVAKLPTIGSMKDVKRISITLVNYRIGPNAPQPTYLVTVFGAMKVVERMPDTESHRRMRILFDAKGGELAEDNLL
jgi:hypothetical protein